MARSRSSATFNAIREAINGTAFRAIQAIVDAGQSFLARVKHPDGGQRYNTDGGQDVWVHVVDELTGYPVMARLHIPGNILFSLPDEDDTCMVIRPRDAQGPGMSYAVHGDGGPLIAIPQWLATKVGLYTYKKLRLESSQEDVEVQSGPDKDISLNGGSLEVARRTDTVDKTTGPGSLGAWMTAVESAFSALGVTIPPVTGAIGNISAGAPHVKA